MRKIVVGLLTMVFLVSSLDGCKKGDKIIQVNLTEVAHSIFYAPMYVAIEDGYFKEEGLDVKLVNGLGADKTMTALLSGRAEITWVLPNCIYWNICGKKVYYKTK